MTAVGVLPVHHPRRRRLSAWSRRHDLTIFFVLAFLLSWSLWPLVALNPDSTPLVPFGPLIAAVVVASLTGGRRDLKHLAAQLARWRCGVGWYLLALLIPVAITGLAAAATSALGRPMAPDSPLAWISVVATFASTLLLVGLFEEVGWRGYALPRLQQKMTGLGAALVLGLIWAVWHLPELVSDPTRQRPAPQFLIMIVAQSVILAWLYLSTAGALPIVMLSHAMIDTAARFVLPSFTQNGYQMVWWFLAGLWTLGAVLVVFVSGRGLDRRRRLRP